MLACSILKTCWLKCCCSFSLARLMQNCSKSFTLNASKPAHGAASGAPSNYSLTECMESC